MKSTGMVRKIDELGRVVIPKELRRTLGIDNQDPLEIFIDGEKVILKKYKPNMTCAVTGEVSDDNLVLLGGKLVLSLNEAKKLVTEIKSK
ncbi:AbrB/MazE/SpoVT family DNA-binding domain-containing protein [Lysinibacillus fusiformis]|uniref:AbrB/MazE/SpoVT family DNA-binding domain-containing protein n=1 Tax=Lysinibacillus fusiformis TaxID=28031 RepID=UPI002D79A4A7|nr:AbrB/MazE/SpoVT family DNA-binding domain-containing protein [Lysinibacillus fusiformis]WRS99909.1 AbrB/MazE/SpoVT family DNA-binding domain-containing protein [Lysinibacillus fusiformis]